MSEEFKIPLRKGEDCPGCGQRSHDMYSDCPLFNNPHDLGFWARDPHTVQMENLNKLARLEREFKEKRK